MNIKEYFFLILEPCSKNEDLRRRELILNIFLFFTIILFFIMCIFAGYRTWIVGSDYSDQGISFFSLFLIFSFYIFLFKLSKAGYVRLSSFIFLFLYFIPNTFLIYKWGADIPVALLFYVLIIIMSSILINIKISFFFYFLISFFIGLIGILQINNFLKPNLYWTQEPLTFLDIIIYIVILGIITIISWIYNREINKALKRAIKSEENLKQERDMLEITVRKKTEELKIAQMEKMSQLYKFAEFGKISSGLFHDIINPLTVISLNLEQVQKKNNNLETRLCIDKAMESARYMEKFITIIKKQIKKNDEKIFFSIKNEIDEVINLLSHKIIQNDIKIKIICQNQIKILGNPIKFNQIILNIISNAIDAYK